MKTLKTGKRLPGNIFWQCFREWFWRKLLGTNARSVIVYNLDTIFLFLHHFVRHLEWKVLPTNTFTENISNNDVDNDNMNNVVFAVNSMDSVFPELSVSISTRGHGESFLKWHPFSSLSSLPLNSISIHISIIIGHSILQIPSIFAASLSSSIVFWSLFT